MCFKKILGHRLFTFNREAINWLNKRAELGNTRQSSDVLTQFAISQVFTESFNGIKLQKSEWANT